MNLRERLSGRLSKEELEHLHTSFDIVGDIAIIKVPEELEHRKAVIAEAVLEQHNNVSTVIRKTGERSGEYRTADYELIVGDSTETIHREHGCRFKLDPTKVYFSERLGHERQRIMEQAKPDETVIDMFAGVGPFSILLARNAGVQAVHAIEKNPAGADYLKQNVTLNKVADRVRPYEGDVRDVLPDLSIKADRILMNLPEHALEFAELALEHVNDGGIIHLYTFVAKDDMWDAADETIRERFTEHGSSIEILHREVCGHYNPAVERACYDIRIRNT